MPHTAPYATPHSGPDLRVTSAPHPGMPDTEADRHLSWPALPASVVSGAAFALGAGFYRAFTGHHALFPSGTAGWALAVLAYVIVGHLVLLGRARWGAAPAPAPRSPSPSCCCTAGWRPDWSASPSSSWSA